MALSETSYGNQRSRGYRYNPRGRGISTGLVPIDAIPVATPRFLKAVVPAGPRSHGLGIGFPVEDPWDASRPCG